MGKSAGISEGFVSRLGQAMDLRKTTKSRLARAVGCNKSHITGIFQGSNPSATMLKQLAYVLAVREEWLAHGTGEVEEGSVEQLQASQETVQEALALVREVARQRPDRVASMAATLRALLLSALVVAPAQLAFAFDQGADPAPGRHNTSPRRGARGKDSTCNEKCAA